MTLWLELSQIGARPRMLPGRLLRACSYAALLVSATSIVHAQPRSMFGTPGIIDMPSARFAPDGELSVGASYLKNTQHYNFSFQALPWLEASFRYSGIEDFAQEYPVYYDRSFAIKARLWDETDIWPAVAVGINDVIGTGIYAGEYVVASKRIGAVDLTAGIGWGRLGTANTLRNPLRLISESFNKPRVGAAPGDTNFGLLFHGPTAGFFGGATWDTPVAGLTLLAEYSSDSYATELQNGSFAAKSQFNFGAAYQLFDSTTLSVSWVYGRSIGASVAFQMNPVSSPFPQRMGPPPSTPRIRTPEEQMQALAKLAGRTGTAASSFPTSLADFLWAPGGAIRSSTLQGDTLVVVAAPNQDPVRLCAQVASLAADDGLHLASVQVTTPQRGNANCAPPASRLPLIRPASFQTVRTATTANGIMTIDASKNAPVRVDTALATIRRAAAAQSIPIKAITLNGALLTVYYANETYLQERDALERLVQLLMAEAPPDAEQFRLINVINNVPQRAFEVLRTPLERNFVQRPAEEMLESMRDGPAPLNTIDLTRQSGPYPKFAWSLLPQFRQQLFDPSNPFAVQLLAALGTTVTLLPGLTLDAQAEASLFDNFNTLRPSDSVLPHVRTDFVKYFVTGKTGISQLAMSYRFRLAPNVYATARAGYLESMFAGVGGEILWRPEGQRWALGADIYGVRQRNFDRLFGFQSYDVITGHVSLYYASPWYGLNFVARAGRYLAGDTGLTLEVTRRFASGVEIGTFMTKTNVSSARFGEGSFDKGIIIRIPIGFMVPLNTQGALAMDLRPVQRDGGQRLSNDATLYDETLRASEAEMRLVSPTTQWE